MTMPQSVNDLNSGWKVQMRPPLLTRRYEFTDFAATRRFLDDLTALSERTGYYPDLNFARTHVSLTIAPAGNTFVPEELAFANEADDLAQQAGN